VLLVLIVCCNAVVLSKKDVSYHYMSAPWTPFKSDESIDYTKIPLVAAFEKKAGVTHSWINGGMAQWAQLSVPERKKVAEEWVKAGHQNGLSIIIHVFSDCLEEAKEMARHARTIGADAIALLPPSYPNRAPNLKILVQFMAKIAEASDWLPFYYYHFPGSTGVDIKMVDLIKESQGVIQNFVGIKYVANDFNDFWAAQQMGVDMFWAAEPKIQSLPYGTTSFVLAESYYCPYLSNVITTWYGSQSSLALQAQQRLNTLQGLVGGASKDVFKMMGIDLGPPRLPKVPISQEEYDRVFAALTKFGFFNQTASVNSMKRKL